MFVLIMFMGGIYYKLAYFSSFFQICISHHVLHVCMYIGYKIMSDLMKIIIIMFILKCYFSKEHIALS